MYNEANGISYIRAWYHEPVVDAENIRLFFAVDNSSAGFTMVSAVEIEEEGDCDYIVTVPDNAKYMMISANENGEGIWVRRINVLTE